MVSQKNIKRFFIILGIIILIATAFYGFGQFKPQKPIQGQIVLKYKNFETKNPAFDFTFGYPETGWLPVETAGRIEKYDLVYLRGPVDKEKGFTNIIHVTVRPLETAKTAPELLEIYLKIDSNLRKFKVIKRKTIQIAEREATSALYEYAVSLPRSDLKSDLVLIKGTMIFFVKNNKFYEITFSAIASQYSIYEPILGHVLETFKFTE